MGAKKTPDASAVAAAEATEALEKEEAAAAAAVAASLQAQQEAEAATVRLQQQQQEDELDVVAVGAVAHVIRRAFHAFYASPEAVDHTTEALDADAATPTDFESLQATEGTVEVSKQDEALQAEPQAQEEAEKRPLREMELSPFVAIAQSRKDAIAKQLERKHERARTLLQFMDERQRQAADADTQIAEQLSHKGLVIKAQIPVGPSHLKLDEQDMKAATDAGTDFGEFGDALLHAKTLVAEYEQRKKEMSGNIKRVPTRRTAAGEGSSENGEQVGYLDTTSSSSIRKEATLEQHKYHIAGVKVAHAEHRVASKMSPHKDDMNQDGDMAVATLTPLSTALEQQERKALTQVMNPIEKRENMAILERMQTKLDFVRNPRYAVPIQLNTINDNMEEDLVELPESNSSSKPNFDIVPKPPVMFTDYDIGGIYEQVVYVRNTSLLSRRARIIPPATIFFSMTSVSFPEESGMIAPGMHVELRIRFAPDSRADYKDSFIVQYETEQSVAPGSTGTPGAAGSAKMVVPLMARREPPELTLPLIVCAQNTLVGGRSVTSLICKNLGGKARFWLLSEPAWSRLEHLQSIDGISPARSAVEMLGGEYQHGTVMDAGPFRIMPNEIELAKGQSVTFDLIYTPTGVGEQRERFVMVCDNCLVRVFQIVGRGCQVDIAATRVNDSPIDTTIAEMGPLDSLFFPDEVLVNTRTRQTIVIANDTPIDVKYSWKIHPLVEEASIEGGNEDKDKAMVFSLSSDSSPPFRITPDSGVFTLSSLKEFTIEFLPIEARAYAYQATLMINDIPACSMPGPGQMAHLKAAFQTHEDPPLSPRAAAKAAAQKLRDSIPGFSMRLRGKGRLGRFTIVPPLNDSWTPLEDNGLQHAGTAGAESTQLLLQNQTYSSSVVLKNQSDALVAYRWDIARLRQWHLAAGGGSSGSALMSGTEGHPPHFELKILPSMGELSPLGQQRVGITLTPSATGAFSLSIPCRILVPNRINDSPRFERWLLLEGRVAGAEIEITTTEVDFGLVLVGASAESSITIRNPSRSIPTNWKFLHLEGSTSGGDSAGQHLQQSPLGARLRRSSSKESVTSRHSAISSSSGNETERSLFTSRDILPRATVAFAPENGVLAPGEVFTVKATCMAGSLPERFRGRFSCQVAPESRFFADSACTHAVVSTRAEIQCPNVFLSTTRLQLGTTYLGVEIHRTIDLVNVSNLEAAFKFVEPEGVSRAYTLTFSPKQGTIRSKERLVITLNYTPRQVGRFTVVLACSVRGLPAPLGFEVSSNHKGLVLSYELFQAAPSTEESLRKERSFHTTNLLLPKSPKEIALERGISLTDCELEPETNPLSSVPKLSFGNSVPLGEKRTQFLLIRNYSGIEALVDLEAKKFPAAAVNASYLVTGSTSVGSESSSPSTSPSKSRHKRSLGESKSPRSLWSNKTGSYRASVTGQDNLAKPRLTNAKDNGNRFQSDNGRAYLLQRAEDGEDRQILREGRGVAFQLHPARVHVPPWEQVVVRVTCFNNMPGTYVDDVVSRATGAPPVFLHANVGVVGTPLAFDHNCVGLHFGKYVPEGRSPVLLRQPTLTFGAACVRAPSITRTLRVVNRGPQRARLKWKLVENGREDQLVNVTLRVDFGSRVQLRITPGDENNSAAAAPPFIVEPQSVMVPAFSTAPFRVTFDPPKHGVSAPRALLLADVHWYDTSLKETSDADNTGSAVHVTLSSIPSEGGDPRQEDVSNPTRQSNNSPSSTTHVAAGKAIAAVRMANAMVRKPGAMVGSTPASSYSPKCLRVLLSADVIEPELSIDKPRDQLQQVEAPPSPLSGRNGSRRNSVPSVILPLPQLLAPYHVKFTTWSTLMSASAAQHAFHQRELFLVNRLGSRVTFRLECDGPFAVAHADSLAPRHPLSLADLPPAHRRSVAQGESYMFMLPPQMSVRIDLRFLTSASLTTAASATSKPKSKSLLQQLQQPLYSQFDGELRVKFATKSVQTIRLAAVVLQPAIVVSPSVFYFGRVHLAASRFVVLRLANPTIVSARFTVQHVPRPKPISRAQQQEMQQHHAHLTDEPAVFTFSKLSGELRGLTTSLKSAGGWLPTTDSMRDLLGEDATTTHPLVHAPLELRVEFHPRENGRRYRSRFRFAVEHGRDFEVVLEGTGHLGEVDDPRDGDRPLVRVRELEHSYYIFRGT